MKKLYFLWFLIILAFCSVSQSFAMVISNFNFGDEGWTAWVGEGEITWKAKGGNKKGFLQIEDVGGSSYVVYPPAKFLGDLLKYDSGLLTYDIKVFDPVTPLDSVGSGFGRIQLEGGGSNATFDYAPDPPVPSHEFWKRYYVPLTAEAWDSSQENWENVLSDITNFHITLDLIPGNDTIGLDNFKITKKHYHDAAPVPEPSSLLLLGAGLSGLGLLRKKRMIKGLRE